MNDKHSKDECLIVGLCGSHSTGKSYIKDQSSVFLGTDLGIVEENMDVILAKLGYTSPDEVKPNDWWLVEDLMLMHHLQEIDKLKHEGYKNIVCDRTVFDIAAYTIFYNEFINDAFIERVLWYCQHMTAYTHIIYFPIEDIEAKDNGFRKIKGRTSIDIILRGILAKYSIRYRTASSVLPDRRRQITNIFTS